jgi:Protein of unknown function (DUF3892)
MPTATNVRKEMASNGSHRHIEGVCTIDGSHHTRREVVDSIARGNVWTTRSPSGNTAVIRPITYCPASGCLASPYITTRADNQNDDNLENLPPC